jgi:hypothetical protein
MSCCRLRPTEVEGWVWNSHDVSCSPGSVDVQKPGGQSSQGYYSCERHLSVRPPLQNLNGRRGPGVCPRGVVNLNKDHIFEVFGGCRI